MSSDNKMKGLLKGLRLISQIFDSNEKQPEIEIGNPTDVKHVAHIGSDGPIENSPSWMNKFKSVPGLSSSTPININRDIYCKESDDSIKWVSSDSMKRGSRSKNVEEDKYELPLPKSSTKEKSEKPRQPKRNSKHSTPNDTLNESKLTTTEQPIQMDSDSLQLQRTTNDNLPHRIQPDNPKITHSKKTKDIQNVGGSSKPRSKAQVKEPEPNSNEETHFRPGSKTKEFNSNEGTHSKTGSKTKESNERSHSRAGSKSKDSNPNEEAHSRTNSKEITHSRHSSKSKESKPSEGYCSRSNLKATEKQRFGEEDGQLDRGFSEEIMKISYAN